MKIVIIDEEFNFAENVASILRIEGFETEILTDATEAIDALTSHDAKRSDQILLVDVSLAPGLDRSHFTEENTNSFMETGLVLTGILGKRNALPERPERVVLYTAHYTTNLWLKIVEFSQRHGHVTWQKRANADPDEVVGLVRDILESA